MEKQSTDLTASPITLPQHPSGAERYDTDVPGKLKWFEPGNEDYTNWVTQRTEFIKEIDAETKDGNEILADILDAVLESEVPTGLINVIATSLKIGKKARVIHKRRQLWRNVINAVIQLTFTAPSHNDDEFIFSFFQVQHLWRGLGGSALPPGDYKKLYSTVSTKLLVGKLKNKIINFPELDIYVAYKLRQFRVSFHRYQVSLIEY